MRTGDRPRHSGYQPWCGSYWRPSRQPAALYGFQLALRLDGSLVYGEAQWVRWPPSAVTGGIATGRWAHHSLSGGAVRVQHGLRLTLSCTADPTGFRSDSQSPQARSAFKRATVHEYTISGLNGPPAQNCVIHLRRRASLGCNPRTLSIRPTSNEATY